MKRVLPQLSTYGARLLLGAAVIFYLVYYLPAWIVGLLNSDMVIPVVFYQDVVKEGHLCRDWVWGGASFLFPDLLLIFGLDFLTGDGLVALQVAGVAFFLAWPLLLAGIYRRAQGRQPEVFAVQAIFFCVAVSSRWGMDAGLYLFQTFCHGGGFIVVLAGLLLLQAVLGLPRIFLFVALGLVVMSGTASDALVFPNLVLPALGALGFMAWQKRAPVQRCLLGGAVILAAGSAGLLLAQDIFPVKLTSGFTSLRLVHVLHSLWAVWADVDFSHKTVRTLLLVGDAITLPLLGWILWPSTERFRGLTPGAVLVLTFSGLLIIFNWGAAVVSGNYTDLGSTRYILFSLIVPGLLAIGWLSHTLIWRPWARDSLSLAVALFVVGISVRPPPPADYVQSARSFVPFMREIMTREHIEAGLGDYWHANDITFFSDQTVPVRSINEEGSIYRWFNNVRWFEGDSLQTEPAFRFIVIADSDRAAPIEQRFGAPAKISRAPGNLMVWIYGPGEAIRYNPIFGDLGNHHIFPEETRLFLPASSLGASTGEIGGGSIEAKEGRDKEDFLTAGPGMRQMPGRYRMVYAYAYDRAPATGKEVSFDCMIRTSRGEKIVDQAMLPWAGTGTTSLSREVVLPKGEGPTSFQARLYYHASGDIRVDSLTIDYLGK